MLELLEDCDDLQTATEVMLTQQDITSFQDDIGKPFVALVKETLLIVFRLQRISSLLSASLTRIRYQPLLL